jgi:hypothetical protein
VQEAAARSPDLRCCLSSAEEGAGREGDGSDNCGGGGGGGVDEGCRGGRTWQVAGPKGDGGGAREEGSLL